jgi:ribose transport system permease protein
MHVDDLNQKGRVNVATQSTAGSDTSTASVQRSLSRGGGLWNLVLESQALVLLVFTILFSIAVGVMTRDFLQVMNIAMVSRQAAYVALVSLGQMLVLMTGLVDLSVGSVAGFAGVVAAMLIHHTSINPYLALLAGLLVGTAIGFTNGFLVTRLRLNAFVATLSTSFIVSGAIMVVTKGWAVSGMPRSIGWLGKGAIGQVPIPTLIALLIAAGLAFMLNRTYVGRHILAVGGNEEAALVVGVRIGRIKTLVYTISSTLAALAGLMMLARLASAQPTVGVVWLLPSFAAPILGGTAMSGGVGSTLGTLVGAMLMAIIQNAIVMTRVSVYWQEVMVGAVLIVAMALDRLRARVRSR